MKEYKYILDKNGIAVPCDALVEWAKWMGTERAQYHLTDEIAGIRVSTIFLGLDHSFAGGEPILWETMVFNDDEATARRVMGQKFIGAPDLGQWRFTFRGDAVAFHRKKVKEYEELLLASGTTSPD